MANTLDALRMLIEENPHLMTTLLGGGAGATVGALSSDEGARGRGALNGGLLGGITGLGAGLATGKAQEIAELLKPNRAKALAVGGVAGGMLGGQMAKQHVSPWVEKRLQEAGLAGDEPNTEAKEAAAMSEPEKKEDLVKKAELEKQAKERMSAFDFGMEVYLNEVGINKEALSKHLGLEHPGLLGPSTILWLTEKQ